MRKNLINMLLNIKNSQLVKKKYIYQKKNKNCQKILDIMWNEGLIIGYQNSRNLEDYYEIFLKYTKDKKPIIKSIKIIYKKNQTKNQTLKQLWKINSTAQTLILSTSKGLMSLHDCKKFKINGVPYLLIF